MNTNEMKDIIQPAVDAFVSAPWEDKQFYMMYLSQAYYYTAHSTRMLAMAAGLCTLEQKAYYSRCIHHIAEEQGHDNLALKDFERLGGKIADYPENPVTRVLWEPQFVKIQRNPVSLLGYILGLEYRVILGNALVYKRLQQVYKPTSVNFIRVHTEEDPDHVNKAIEQIQKLGQSDQAAVWDNYKQTARVFCLFIDEIKANCGSKPLRLIKTA